MTVVGIDLSLTSTGLALAKWGTIVETQAVKTKALPPEEKADLGAISRRITTIFDAVNDFIFRVRPQLVVIEAPSLNSKYGAAHDRSGLWWLVVDRAVSRGYPVAQVTPTARAKYGCGKGNGQKKEVHDAVKATYGRPDLLIPSNDEADAVILAAMGSRHLGKPVEASLPDSHLSAMEKVVWP